MKTVICFDTEDESGMRDAYTIMAHLTKVHLGKRLPNDNTLIVGKIQFIKALRRYVDHIEDKCDNRNGLKEAKMFADAYWEENIGGPF